MRVDLDRENWEHKHPERLLLSEKGTKVFRENVRRVTRKDEESLIKDIKLLYKE